MVIGRSLCWMMVAAVAVASIGCASDQVRGDDLYPQQPAFDVSEEAEIEDSPEVREVLDVLYQYREALVSKDYGSLNRIVSEQYYDNAGTTHTTEDDYGYDELADIYEMTAEYADQIQYDIRVKDVVVDGYRAHVDFEFEYAYQFHIGDQERWDAGVDVNRLELQRENNRWRIVSGM